MTRRHHPTPRRPGSQRGGALLAVLWISAALTAIAFSMANTIRTETDRTFTLSEGVRTYFVATGAIERMRLYIEWGPSHLTPDGKPRYFAPGMPRVLMNFPTGFASVEVFPETAKLSVNVGNPEEIFRLINLLGVEPGRAREITSAIIDWRTGMPGNMSLFDQYYLSLTPSFRGRHSSLEQIEELLLVRGVTPELFYGTLVRDPEGRLIQQPGLKDCLSVYGAELGLDVNHSEPQVLLAAGLSPEVVGQILERRKVAAFRQPEELTRFIQFGGPAARRLVIGGSTIFTFRATAQLRRPDGSLSDMHRSVSAMLKFHQITRRMTTPPVEVLRWYDY